MEGKMSQANVEIVGAMYAKFGAGDIPGILEGFADDATWENPGPAGIEPPYFGTHSGKDGILGVFAMIGELFDFTVFNPYTIVPAGDDKVIALLEIEAINRRTGKKAGGEAVHVWTFKDGKVTRFQDFQDSTQIAAAMKP